ncbi:14349_t:CDS:2, partial [Racocetra persica]
QKLDDLEYHETIEEKETFSNNSKYDKEDYEDYNEKDCENYNEEYNEEYNEKYNEEYNKEYNEDHNEKYNEEYNKKHNEKYNKKYNEEYNEEYTEACDKEDNREASEEGSEEESNEDNNKEFDSEYINFEGVQCVDSLIEKTFTLHTHILSWSGNIPALAKVMNTTGHTSYKACHVLGCQYNSKDLLLRTYKNYLRDIVTIEHLHRLLRKHEVQKK